MAGYDARWNLSGGLGYKVIANKALTLNVKAGPAWRQTDLVLGDTESELTGLAALDLGWKLSPTLSLSQVASTIVGERTTTTSSLTALNAKLSGALSARISYSAELDTHPPVGVENLDTLTRFTLVYGF
jgi:putative salt-induced outer membrane protein